MPVAATPSAGDARRGRAVGAGVHRALPHALALAVYAALTVWLTWPVSRHLGDHALGIPGDNLGGVHTLSWVAGEVTSGRYPWSMEMAAWPGGGVVFHPSPLMELLSVPVTAAWNPVAAFNLLTLASFIACGYTAFLLCRHLTGSVPVALGAGALFTASGPHQFDLLFNTNAVWALPWLCLACLRWRRRPERWWEVALAASCLALSNFYFAGYYLPLVFAAFIPWPRWRDVTWVASTVAAVATTLFVTVIAYVPPLLAASDATRGQLEATAALTTSRPPTELLSLVIGSPQHPRLGGMFAGWAEGLDPTQAPLQGSAYLGLVVLVLAALGAVRAWRSGPWVLLGGTALVLMLGPELLVAGHRVMPLPYALLDHVPVLNFLRAPSRFYYLVSICLIVMAAFGLVRAAGWAARVPRAARLAPVAAVAVLAAGGVYDQLFRAPVPLTPVAPPAAYARLAALPAGTVLVEAPGGGFNDYQWLAYQYATGKPLVNDPSPRTTFTEPIPLYQNPFLRFTVAGPDSHEIPTDEAYAQAHGGRTDPARVAGVRQLGRQGVGYVVLHAHTIFGWASPADPGYVQQRRYLERYLGPPAYEDADVAVFALPGAPGLVTLRAG